MQFSTNETVSLDKSISTNVKAPFNNIKDTDNYYEIERCADWIQTNNYKKVCLQFPDHLLPDSSAVALRLQDILQQTVYILGDTCYESCCIDYVAAAHIDADAIIHFGPVCFSQASENVPYLLIFEKCDIDLMLLKQKIEEAQLKRLMILLDSEYVHVKGDLGEFAVFYVHGNYDAKNCNVLYVGNSKKKVMHLKATLACDELFVYESNEIKRYEIDARILKRRYFLSEKIKDSKTIGIVIGTLAVKNYLKVVERMKTLLTAHKKKYYIISVGKLTVAKLANFPEIELYILISCSMNDVFENRDFYQPIVTPFDVEIALNNKPLDTPFSYDYNHYLDFSEVINVPSETNESDVSLITGKLRRNAEEVATDVENQVALKSEGTLALNSEYLKQRSWRGLEQNLGRSEVKLAEEGRSGTAFGYENETK